MCQVYNTGLFHGKHLGNLLAERPLLRNAVPAGKPTRGLPELSHENDVAAAANRIVAFNGSPQDKGSVLESSSFELIGPAALKNRHSADPDQGQ